MSNDETTSNESAEVVPDATGSTETTSATVTTTSSTSVTPDAVVSEDLVANSDDFAENSDDFAENANLIYRLSGVRRTFNVGGTEVRAVDGVDLEIGRGEFVAVQGPSGSGKSTLLQLLGGLDRATSGILELNGKELSKLKEKALTQARSRDIGFVFQQFNLIPTLTAVQNVEIAMVPAGVSKGERHQRAVELLTKIGLGHRLEHLPYLLSGGEQQRVAICRALANRPSVLLADEPTGNLDSVTADEVVTVLGDLVRDEGVTVVLVTHAEEVASRASRRLKMRDGKFVDVSPSAVV